MKKAILSVWLFLVATALAYPQLVTFKLTGGLAWINGDDYNRGVVGENKYIRGMAETTSGAFKELNKGMNFAGEIIVHMNSHLGIGFGGGYYRLSNESTVRSQGVLSDIPFDSTSTYKPSLSAIPLFVNFHYMGRLVSRLGFDIYAGPLFQVVQFSFENPSTTTVLSTSQTLTYTASVTTLGAQAGFGLNFEIFPGIALTAEGCYRYGKVSDLKGNWAVIGTSESGPFNNSSAEYYLWVYDDTSGGTYTRIGFFDINGPAGDSVSSMRKADINLSGFTATAGLRFYF
jgi:hypothetical protein